MLHPFVKKLGYRFHYRFDPRNSGLRKILVLTFPIMLGNTIQTIDVLVNRMLASGLEEGSIAALNYSNKLAIFIVGVVSLGAGTVCYTKMSELSASGEMDEFKKFLRSVVNLLNVIVVPAAVGMMALNVPITRFVFEYGAFDSRSSQMTSVTLLFYSVGLVGFVLRDIITRAFYALNDAKTPMVNGGIAVSVGIACNFIFVRFLGVGGLALATSVSGILGTLLLLFSLRNKLGSIGLTEMGITFLKACISAIIMGFAVHIQYSALYGMTGSLPAALFISVFCGILIYAVLILLLNVREARDLAARLKRGREK
jgi:putative peptidoglycan lipid II flippase